MIIDELRDPAAEASHALYDARQLPPLVVNRDVAQLMRRYVPDAVVPKLDAGIRDVHIAELREVSVLFINCHGVALAADGAEGSLKTVTQDGTKLMKRVQKLVTQYEGSVNKMLVDDKGTLIICALGLPPRPHPDDPTRAVGLALDLVSAMRRMRSSSYDQAESRGRDSGRECSHQSPPPPPTPPPTPFPKRRARWLGNARQHLWLSPPSLVLASRGRVRRRVGPSVDGQCGAGRGGATARADIAHNARGLAVAGGGAHVGTSRSIGRRVDCGGQRGAAGGGAAYDLQ